MCKFSYFNLANTWQSYPFLHSTQCTLVLECIGLPYPHQLFPVMNHSCLSSSSLFIRLEGEGVHFLHSFPYGKLPLMMETVALDSFTNYIISAAESVPWEHTDPTKSPHGPMKSLQSSKLARKLTEFINHHTLKPISSTTKKIVQKRELWSVSLRNSPGAHL